MKTKSISIRIDEELLKKIGHIAAYEGRSINGHILMLIRRNIESFELTHGKIQSL